VCQVFFYLILSDPLALFKNPTTSKKWSTFILSSKSKKRSKKKAQETKTTTTSITMWSPTIAGTDIA
jgi:hypothetical protein